MGRVVITERPSSGFHDRALVQPENIATPFIKKTRAAFNESSNIGHLIFIPATLTHDAEIAWQFVDRQVELIPLFEEETDTAPLPTSQLLGLPRTRELVLDKRIALRRSGVLGRNRLHALCDPVQAQDRGIEIHVDYGIRPSRHRRWVDNRRVARAPFVRATVGGRESLGQYTPHCHPGWTSPARTGAAKRRADRDAAKNQYRHEFRRFRYSLQVRTGASARAANRSSPGCNRAPRLPVRRRGVGTGSSW